VAIYAIGDIQGCFPSLQKLLKKIKFDANSDQLWFAGDLVNRGPQSLQTLRYVKSLGPSAVTVLGNHDLHLLAKADGTRPNSKHKSLREIVNAPDRDDLLNWLRHRPLIYSNDEYCLVHAGIAPQWNFPQALSCAAEVESILRSERYSEFIAVMYGDKPDHWDASLEGMDRLRYIVNVFTRMRYCNTQGQLNFEYSGAPRANEHSELIPWFEFPKRETIERKIVFGHWSTLGFHEDAQCIAIDTGCLWGGKLTAIRLDNSSYKRFSVNCPNYRKHTKS